MWKKSSLYYSTAVMLLHASDVSVCHLEKYYLCYRILSCNLIRMSCFVFSSVSASSPAMFTTKYYWINLYTPVTALNTEMSDMHPYLTDWSVVIILCCHTSWQYQMIQNCKSQSETHNIKMFTNKHAVQNELQRW